MYYVSYALGYGEYAVTIAVAISLLTPFTTKGEAKVNVLDEETKNELRNITQQDSTICFSVKENPNIVGEKPDEE